MLEKTFINPLMLSRKVKLAVSKMIMSLKRKQFFSSSDNLKYYHYDVINDLGGYHEERRWEGRKRVGQTTEAWFDIIRRDGQSVFSTAVGKKRKN
jgi:hypothetical protein